MLDRSFGPTCLGQLDPVSRPALLPAFHECDLLIPRTGLLVI